jgi:hypothetical protein
MVNYIIPAMLTPSAPRRTIQLDSKVIEKYVGDDELQKLKIPLTIFRGVTSFFLGVRMKKKGR